MTVPGGVRAGLGVVRAGPDMARAGLESHRFIFWALGRGWKAEIWHEGGHGHYKDYGQARGGQCRPGRGQGRRGEFLPPALALALAAAGAGPDKSDPVAGRSRNE